MPKKKGFVPEKYKSVILEVLRENKLMATNEVCSKLDMGYYTALKYLEDLHKKGKIKLRKFSNRNIWYV